MEGEPREAPLICISRKLWARERSPYPNPKTVTAPPSTPRLAPVHRPRPPESWGGQSPQGRERSDLQGLAGTGSELTALNHPAGSDPDGVEQFEWGAPRGRVHGVVGKACLRESPPCPAPPGLPARANWQDPHILGSEPHLSPKSKGGHQAGGSTSRNLHGN